MSLSSPAEGLRILTSRVYVRSKRANRASRHAPMTYLHGEVQYIVLSIAGNGIPGSIAALRLPD